MKSNLKAAREARGISQAELSRESGVDAQTVSALENNEARNLTSKLLVALADALKVTVDELFI